MFDSPLSDDSLNRLPKTSVKGTMNQMAGDIVRMLWIEDARVEDICSYATGAWLADRPCTVKGQKDCVWPDRAMLALLNRFVTDSLT